MSTYANKPVLSLIERKKLQWAKEKEELARLSGLWNSRDSSCGIEATATFGRTRYGSNKCTMPNNEYSENESSRRSSLPPLYKNQYNSIDRDKGGETSGYGSDNPNQTNEFVHPPAPWNQLGGYESSSSYRDDRPKWKDKNLAKFWESSSKEADLYEMKSAANEPPNWVKRGLQTDEEIVVSNTSPAESPQQPPSDDGGSNHPDSNRHSSRTYVRGQNIPLDSAELAEREQKRQIALAHQEAVRQQLEDREKLRQREKEQRIREEREEELRIERDQEIERQRRENELRMVEAKRERERRRKEALQEALDVAEREAKLEKKAKRIGCAKLSSNTNNNNNNVLDPDLNGVEKVYTESIKSSGLMEKQDVEKAEKNTNNLLEQQNGTNVLICAPQETTKILHNNIAKDSSDSKVSNTCPKDLLLTTTLQNLCSPKLDNLALVFQSPLETLQSMQYAVLLNNSSSTPIPIAVPITIASDGNPTSSVNSSVRTENRLLTPTQYRNNKNSKTLIDSSTQTEYHDFINRTEEDSPSSNNKKYSFRRDNKLNNVEIIYDNNNNSRSIGVSNDRRTRNESIDATIRPKWGVNRPPTRYLKQSEKDPLYQRRKLRTQKIRGGSDPSKMYVNDYKNSSDESQTPASPVRSYRKSYNAENRRAFWRENDRFFARNIRMYQTEIVPLESDRDQIYYNNSRQMSSCQHCCCRCNCSINANTRSDSDVLKIDQDQLPKDQLLVQPPTSSLCSLNNKQNSNDLLLMDKLALLHQEGLLLSTKHEHHQWDHSPRTTSLSSSTRNT